MNPYAESAAVYAFLQARPTCPKNASYEEKRIYDEWLSNMVDNVRNSVSDDMPEHVARHMGRDIGLLTNYFYLKRGKLC